MRIGVLGMGRWGRTVIAAFDRQAEVVVACNTGGQESQAWLREAFPRIRAGGGAHEAIADGSLDAIVIATPIATHAALATEALRAGKHVLVEKPLAMRRDDAVRVVTTADEAGRVLFTGHTFLFDAGLQWLDREVDRQSVSSVRTTWHKYGTFGEPLVWNLLPHDLAIVLSLCGGPLAALSVQQAAAGETELDLLELALDVGSASCVIEIDRMRGERSRQVEVQTRDGTSYRWSDGAVDRTRSGQAERVVEPTEAPLDREVRAFLQACSSGVAPAGADGPFAIQVVDVVEQVLEDLDRRQRDEARAATGLRS